MERRDAATAPSLSRLHLPPRLCGIAILSSPRLRVRCSPFTCSRRDIAAPRLISGAKPTGAASAGQKETGTMADEFLTLSTLR